MINLLLEKNILKNVVCNSLPRSQSYNRNLQCYNNVLACYNAGVVAL